MIEINNLTTNPVDKEFLKEACQKVLREEGKKPTVQTRGAQLSIALVGQERMRKLNKRYRGKNRVTDVLTFKTNQKPEFVMPPGEKAGLGEIVICLPVLKKNAKKFNSTFEKELVTSLIHGILHLLGYEHEKSEVEAKKMQEKQQYYLKQFNL